MTTVSCPKCSDRVSVPASAPRSARVRCPLCQEEYDLADALAQLPPALIIVSAGIADEPVLAAVGGMDRAMGEGFGRRFDEGSNKGYSTSVLEAEPTHAEMVSAPTPAFRSAPRPKRKEKSMVGELVKIVLGGVVGIGLAIVILWWAAGVDLGLAPTVAKVSWLRWVLPPKFRDEADKNQVGKEENPTESQPIKAEYDKPVPSGAGKLGSDPRFENALKTSGTAKASSKFDNQGDPLDVSDPFALEKGSGVTGELKIDSPLLSEPKAPAKKPAPAKTKPAAVVEEPGEDDPFKLPATTTPAKPAKPAEPAEPTEDKPPEKPAEKPTGEKPAADKPKVEQPAEQPGEKPVAEKPDPDKPKAEKPAENPQDVKPADEKPNVEPAPGQPADKSP